MAGVLLCIIELDPGRSHIRRLQSEIKQKRTDVAPDPSSHDAYQLRGWTQDAELPTLSREFRLARMIRVVKITPESQQEALRAFDGVVMDIETSVSNEASSGRIPGNWSPCGDERTCAACDFRHFCPSPSEQRQNAKYLPKAPAAP